MEYFLIASLALVFFLIIFVNDARVRLTSIHGQTDVNKSPQEIHAKRVNVIQWMFIGGLWFLFYEIFDSLIENYLKEQTLVFRIIVFALMIFIIAIVKFVFKRNLINNSF